MIQKNERHRYASDLSDSQWAIIQPLLPPAGNKSKWEKRELIDAVLYFVDNGCKWRNLPHDFPPYTTVANFYYAAIRSGPCGASGTGADKHGAERRPQLRNHRLAKRKNHRCRRRTGNRRGKKQKGANGTS